MLRHVDDLTEYRAHIGRMEVEAEFVAFTVAGLSGSDTSACSIGYINGRAGTDTTLVRDITARVLTTAHAIAQTIEQYD